MFENFSHSVLQHYWWIIVSLLAAILVFLMFVQGGQTFVYSLGKTKTQRKMVVNALGRKWEFTFTTLVTFGGAFFASFPLFYATSFGGAYWVWLLILFAFIIQAVAYEFRSKPNNIFGSGTYEAFLFINGLLGTVLIGTAVATFFTGSDFRLDDMNRVTWGNSWRGLELAFSFGRYETYINLSLGLAVFFLARSLGLMYFLNSIDDETLDKRIRKKLWYSALLFLVLFLFFLVNILVMKGYAVDPETRIVFLEQYKYLNNLLNMPIVLIIFLTGVVAVLFGLIVSLTKASTKGIWSAGFGTILTVFALLLVAGFNNTAFYPSYSNLQSSLTIANASSSKYTLTAMSYVSLVVPFVIAYIWYAWKAINKKKIDEEEMSDEESHAY
ncbi:MAG: cytochrome d ubiquinol oxidase subunit II [Bacteroidales bacterium]|nr:cytochrome d ubiquinol oxidase subunit II [Bacteroidales bacterium]MCF8349555.1 cytochrome d ubiquinol oxidase subunit II [Bacteroidales bacterium]MCF8375114.1 cytochrome d ubiquinol oxidase subunit II [Bacteroidales bacterium]MCF8400021.1 cytochrome d ubiquinol oxidase subunit II [Bacteroidales bacterium]